MITVVVFATIAGAIVCWAGGEWFRSRTLWTAGAVLAITHSIAAFGVFHGWSHDAAYIATAQQTAALTGLRWGGGLYINYLFLFVWAGDAVWWWVSPRTYRRRPAPISWLVRGFLFFMFFNGAIVFADGWMRVLGTIAVGIVGCSWLITHYRPVTAAS